MVRWRSQSVTSEQTDHGAATYLQSQLQHFALDLSRSPMRILASEANDQALDLFSQRRSSGSALLPESPVSPHELAVPAEQSVRLHDQEGRGQTPLREAQGRQQQG